MRTALPAMLTSTSVGLCALLLAGLLAMRATAEEGAAPATSTWPQTVDAQGMELRLFCPHAVALEGDRLSSRAVISRAEVGADGQLAEPAFGVAWVTSHADIDRDARTITLSGQEVTRIALAGASDQDSARIAAILRDTLRERQPVLHLDRVLTAIESHQAAKAEAARIGDGPPAILIAHTPSLLVRIDGPPAVEAIAGSRWQRVVNTPFMIAYDPQSGAYWLYHGARWHTAPSITASWRLVDQVPDQVAALAPALAGYATAQAAETDGPPEDIVVSTAPAELISFDGQPFWEGVPGGQLLACTNTDRDVFRDPASGQVFVLLSGRWFATADLERGPWRAVAPDQLPADFANIPSDCPWADIRAHVAGTPEAQEAVLDAHLPQTAAIPRDATTTVTYDGDPAWQSIQGTQLSYALNTDQEVIAAQGGVYSCCDQGVWYVANAPNGPWSAATATPTGIDTIPPDCPIYNVRFVQVYECTPEVCYCGYTAGYTGCYVHDGCLVWGTGYAYDPWWNHHYHARLWTWGLGMSYDPRTCAWGTDVEARFGGSAGWSAFGSRGAGGRWWGVGGYRAAYIHSGRPDAQAVARERERIPAAERPRYERAQSHDLYHDRARVPVRPEPQRPLPPPVHAAAPVRVPAPTETFHSTADGDIYRHGDQGWEHWQGNRWEPEPVRPEPPLHAPVSAPEPEHRPAPEAGRPTAAPQPARGAWAPETRQDLERQRAQDARAEQRTSDFQHARASTAPVRRPILRDDRSDHR